MRIRDNLFRSVNFSKIGVFKRNSVKYNAKLEKIPVPRRHIKKKT